ncbi:MAG: aldehyde ferredoxin oxidoreductase N-terminal domain-containing protein, partial [Desulfitobacteriaceae bacterium]
MDMVTATIWFVDLPSGRIWSEVLDEATYRRYPGGSALAVYLLLQHLAPGVQPLSPDNVLVFAVSPLTGLPISGQSRVIISARSPLTGGIGDSQGGGLFP